ncbi:hypothetical protein FLACOL_01902 [Flavobacterium columnare]|uniref:Uncharacterized protein n=1 Tax=Flavobacterium columnare TaxID=996 RepID=A0A2N9PC07_9FLAO|nr:hypothetical protein FLACOL_01902 [Flavobacterium columnare]
MNYAHLKLVLKDAFFTNVLKITNNYLSSLFFRKSCCNSKKNNSKKYGSLRSDLINLPFKYKEIIALQNNTFIK